MEPKRTVDQSQLVECKEASLALSAAVDEAISTALGQGSLSSDTRLQSPEYIRWITLVLTQLRRVIESKGLHDPLRELIIPHLPEIASYDPEALATARHNAIEYIKGKRPTQEQRTRILEGTHHSMQSLLSATPIPFMVPVDRYIEYGQRFKDLAKKMPRPAKSTADEDAEIQMRSYSDLAILSLMPLVRGAEDGRFIASLSLLNIATWTTSLLNDPEVKNQDMLHWLSPRVSDWPHLLSQRKQSFNRARTRVKDLEVGQRFMKWPGAVALADSEPITKESRPRDIANAYAIALCYYLHSTRDWARQQIQDSINLGLPLLDSKKYPQYVKHMVDMCNADDMEGRKITRLICEHLHIPIAHAMRENLNVTNEGSELDRLLFCFKQNWYGKAAFLPPFSKATANQWWDLAEEILLEQYRETDRAKKTRFAFKEKDGSESDLMRLAFKNAIPITKKEKALAWSRVENRILTKLKAAFVRLAPSTTRAKNK